MPATEAAMSAADRRQVQATLQRLGYDPGPVDAIFGPRTRAAIRRFQQDIGAQQTGSLTGEQVSRLLSNRQPAEAVR